MIRTQKTHLYFQFTFLMSIARSNSRNDVIDFLTGKDQAKPNPVPPGVETVKNNTDPKYPNKPTDDTLIPKKVNAVPAD